MSTLASGVATVAIKTETNKIRNGGRASTNLPNDVATALEKLQDNQNALNGSISKIASGGGSTTSASIFEQEVLLSHTSTTTINPVTPAVVPGVLFVVLTCDSTAGDQITWGTGFAGATSDDIDNAANAINIYTFVGRSDGNWWLSASNLGA